MLPLFRKQRGAIHFHSLWYMVELYEKIKAAMAAPDDDPQTEEQEAELKAAQAAELSDIVQEDLDMTAIYPDAETAAERQARVGGGAGWGADASRWLPPHGDIPKPPW